jgi:hypothetical protein
MTVGYDSAPLPGKREVSHEVADELVRDIGRYSMLRTLASERIAERSTGKVRSALRFVFHHGDWADDQYWINRQRANIFEAKKFSMIATLALEGEISVSFYHGMISLSRLDLVRIDALGGEKSPHALHEATQLTPAMLGEPVLIDAEQSL